MALEQRSAPFVHAARQLPSPDQEAVYVPPSLPAPSLSAVEPKARLANARVRAGLPVSEGILESIIALGFVSDPGRVGVYSADERQDIFGQERVERARLVLADAVDVFGGLQLVLG